MYDVMMMYKIKQQEIKPRAVTINATNKGSRPKIHDNTKGRDPPPSQVGHAWSLL